MPTSRVQTNLFLTFEIATKEQNVCYTSDPLNQPIRVHAERSKAKKILKYII